MNRTSGDRDDGDNSTKRLDWSLGSVTATGRIKQGEERLNFGESVPNELALVLSDGYILKKCLAGERTAEGEARVKRLRQMRPQPLSRNFIDPSLPRRSIHKKNSAQKQVRFSEKPWLKSMVQSMEAVIDHLDDELTIEGGLVDGAQRSTESTIGRSVEGDRLQSERKVSCRYCEVDTVQLDQTSRDHTTCYKEVGDCTAERFFRSPSPKLGSHGGNRNRVETQDLRCIEWGCLVPSLDIDQSLVHETAALREVRVLTSKKRGSGSECGFSVSKPKMVERLTIGLFPSQDVDSCRLLHHNYFLLPSVLTLGQFRRYIAGRFGLKILQFFSYNRQIIDDQLSMGEIADQCRMSSDGVTELTYSISAES